MIAVKSVNVFLPSNDFNDWDHTVNGAWLMAYGI